MQLGELWLVDAGLLLLLEAYRQIDGWCVRVTAAECLSFLINAHPSRFADISVLAETGSYAMEHGDITWHRRLAS